MFQYFITKEIAVQYMYNKDAFDLFFNNFDGRVGSFSNYFHGQLGGEHSDIMELSWLSCA